MVRLYLSRQLSELRSEPCEYPRADDPWEKGPHVGQCSVRFKEQSRPEAEADCVQESSEMGSLGSPQAQGACGSTWLTAEVL